MAWGSLKQIAFFKSMAEKYKLCGAGHQGGDVFEYEGKLRQHEARYARAIRQAKAMQDRLRKKRSRREMNKLAKRRGFKDVDAQEAAGWHPHDSLRRKKTRPAAAKKVGSRERGYKPFEKGAEARFGNFSRFD